jgi:hypothetical protein
MDEFVSEPITPLPGAFDTHAMAAGLPGLPAGFTWRGQAYEVAQVVQRWKKSAPEGGRPGGERYLRRHYFRLCMRDGTDWVVYFMRQAPRSGAIKARWFLYRIVRSDNVTR